jgi:hypothetical protein
MSRKKIIIGLVVIVLLAGLGYFLYPSFGGQGFMNKNLDTVNVKPGHEGEDKNSIKVLSGDRIGVDVLMETMVLAIDAGGSCEAMETAMNTNGDVYDTLVDEAENFDDIEYMAAVMNLESEIALLNLALEDC